MAVERGGATGCGSAAFSAVSRPPAPPPPTRCRRSWGGHAAAHGLLERAAGSREDKQPLDLLWRGGGGGWRHEGQTTRASRVVGASDWRRCPRRHPSRPSSRHRCLVTPSHAWRQTTPLWLLSCGRGEPTQHRASARIRGAVSVPKARSVKGGRGERGEEPRSQQASPAPGGRDGPGFGCVACRDFLPIRMRKRERVRWSLVGALSSSTPSWKMQRGGDVSRLWRGGSSLVPQARRAGD